MEYQVIEMKAVSDPAKPNTAAKLVQRVVKSFPKPGPAETMVDKLNRAQDLEITTLVSYMVQARPSLALQAKKS
jgi:hypothetical protein